MTAAVRSSRSEPIAPLPLPLAVAEIGKIHFKVTSFPTFGTSTSPWNPASRTCLPSPSWPRSSTGIGLTKL